MSKDLLYRPDLSYDKSYYTDGKLYDLTEDIHINSQDEQDNLSNKLNHIDDLLKDIISKLPIIPEDLLDVFLPPFITVNDVLKDLIDNKSLYFYCVADNIRKGAASNAVQIALKILRNIN